MSIPEPTACSVAADVVFVMDSSGSIKMGNFTKQKEFVKLVARNLGISSGQGRAAIVLYNGDAFIKATFDRHNTTVDFEIAVDELDYLGGKTRIDKALEKASELFEYARDGVAKFAVILTDGVQTNDRDAKNLAEASAPLRNQNVRVIAIGIGREIKQSQLRLLVDSEDDMFQPKDFDELKLILGNFIKQLCGKNLVRVRESETCVDLRRLMSPFG